MMLRLERYTAHMSKRLLQGQELEQRARELGVDIQGSPRTGSSSGTRQRAEDHELQQRVIEAERAKRFLEARNGIVVLEATAAIVRLGPVHAAAFLVILASFWFESSILAFRVYNVILPLPSFLMLLFGTYVMGLLAAYWDLEPETDPQQVSLKR